MAKDFSSDQGGTQLSTDTQFDPQEAGTPSVGFTTAPKTKDHTSEVGPGSGNSRRGIR
jgi:hypothetical protein